MSNKNIYYALCICMLIATMSLNAFRRRREDKGAKALAMKNFILQSSAFAYNGDIPEEYTCDGFDYSPPLRWSDPPQGTQSFALLCEDPDAVGGKVWVHWILFDIPGNVRDLPQHFHAASIGASEGTTSWQTKKYGGPCPPLEKHRYVFTLYALDVPNLSLEGEAKRADLLAAMKGHILAKTVLIGRYQRPKNRES